MKSFIPVALFVYNRQDHTRRTVESILTNAGSSQTPLYVFSDAAKNETAKQKVEEVRKYIHSIRGFKSVKIIEREKNFGLAASIISGVSQVLQEHDRIIVLEDDMITSNYFLTYMNDALEFYKNDERVISVHGYMYPLNQNLPETFFLRGADCWGWGTWRRGWELFEADGEMLLRQLQEQKLGRQFDLNGAYPYVKMLKNQIAGKNNSWAIRWHASAFLKDKLTLFPGVSLVHNIGTDESGTHCSDNDYMHVELSETPVKVQKIPVEENVQVRNELSRYFRKLRISLIGSKLRSMRKSIIRI